MVIVAWQHAFGAYNVFSIGDIFGKYKKDASLHPFRKYILIIKKGGNRINPILKNYEKT